MGTASIIMVTVSTSYGFEVIVMIMIDGETYRENFEHWIIFNKIEFHFSCWKLKKFNNFWPAWRIFLRLIITLLQLII